MIRRALLPVLVLLVTLALAAPAASAGAVAAADPNPALAAGNYCVSCHLPDDPRLLTVTDWRGGIAREVNSPCPAATSIHEQLYYTERMLLMIDRRMDSTGSATESLETRLAGYTELYSRQLDQPVTSLDAFTAEALSARYRLNKIYAALDQLSTSRRRQTVYWYAAAVTLVVLASLGWGLYNTRAIRSGKVRRSAAIFWRLSFLLAVLVFFALPILRVPAAEPTVTTADQQAAQAVLDTADRAAAAADRTQARAWMLARLGVAWRDMDAASSEEAFQESLASLQLARQNQTALWGQSLAVQEAMVGVPIDMEKAGLVADDVNAQRLRAWSVALVARELGTLDLARAADLLKAEEALVLPAGGIYRDLQLRSLALAWAALESDEGLAVARQIHDPSILSWTLRELGALTNDASAWDASAEAARQITDPVRRAASLRDLAVASHDDGLFAEALAALDGLRGAQLAYALSDLAAASGDATLVARIDAAFPDARAYALLRLGDYEAARQAAAQILDPYEQARARHAIARLSGSAEAALEIAVPLYRDLALRDVIRKTGAVSLVESIRSAYYRVQAFTAAGMIDKAIESSDGLADSFPLVELTLALAQDEPQMALSLVDRMTRETDKAIVLRALAAVTDDQVLFEQAQGMALAARVSGDPLAPSAALFDLAMALWDIDAANARSALRQAQAAVERIATK